MSDKIVNIISELDDVSCLGNDDVTNWWSSLANIYNQVQNCASEEFKKAYEQEVIDQYNFFKDNFEIVETIKMTEQKIRTLVFIDE